MKLPIIRGWEIMRETKTLGRMTSLAMKQAWKEYRETLLEVSVPATDGTFHLFSVNGVAKITYSGVRGTDTSRVSSVLDMNGGKCEIVTQKNDLLFNKHRRITANSIMFDTYEKWWMACRKYEATESIQTRLEFDFLKIDSIEEKGNFLQKNKSNLENLDFLNEDKKELLELGFLKIADTIDVWSQNDFTYSTELRIA